MNHSIQESLFFKPIKQESLPVIAGSLSHTTVYISNSFLTVDFFFFFFFFKSQLISAEKKPEVPHDVPHPEMQLSFHMTLLD